VFSNEREAARRAGLSAALVRRICGSGSGMVIRECGTPPLVCVLSRDIGCLQTVSSLSAYFHRLKVHRTSELSTVCQAAAGNLAMCVCF